MNGPVRLVIITVRNDLKNLQFLKKGIGIESEKVCKQVRDQIVWKRVEDIAQGLLQNGNNNNDIINDIINFV